MAKCWRAMSASVQCVAIRTTDTPMSRHARMSSIVPRPGSISAAMRERPAAASTAACMSTRSSTAENP